MPELLQIYQTLLAHHGPRAWWPAETPFEVVIGAILTQNTNWSNVEKALDNLRRAAVLTPEAILALAPAELEELIRPSGFFRQKAQRLQLFCQHLHSRHGNDLASLLGQELEPARDELLSLKGVGPETADSILLYAGGRPTFVVDAYTGRLFGRLGLLSGEEAYGEVRALFMSGLPEDVALYNEYHALIVTHCKEFCRKRPLCEPCPCAAICRFRQQRS